MFDDETLHRHYDAAAGAAETAIGGMWRQVMQLNEQACRAEIQGDTRGKDLCLRQADDLVMQIKKIAPSPSMMFGFMPSYCAGLLRSAMTMRVRCSIQFDRRCTPFAASLPRRRGDARLDLLAPPAHDGGDSLLVQTTRPASAPGFFLHRLTHPPAACHVNQLQLGHLTQPATERAFLLCGGRLLGIERLDRDLYARQ